MKGYRCDTCMDFRPPPQAPAGQSLFAAWTTSKNSNGLPDGWVGVDADGHDLQFCSPACLAAFAEATIQAQANVAE